MLHLTIKRLGCLLLPLLVASGCATHRSEQTATYSTLHRPERPVCGQPVACAEEVQPAGNRLTTPVPGGPAIEDLIVGERIRELLMEDKTLAPAPSNVITVVSKGVVKMKGFVRSRRAAMELHQRISTLPGVLSVENELTLWNGHKI